MGVVTPTISSDGQRMDSLYELVAIDISHEVNRIPRAELRLLDGSAPERRFAISDEAFFEPGKEVEIKLRYEDGQDTSVFKGLVMRHGVEATQHDTFLNIGLKDAAIKLTRPRRSAVFSENTDGDIIGRVVEDAGLSKGKIATTQPEHAEIVQYQCSDWDFILARADVHGLLVSVEAGKVSASKIELDASPKHSFEFGLSELFDFEMEVGVGHQSSTVESIAWDVASQKLTSATSAKPFHLSQGNLQGDVLARKVGFAPSTLTYSAPLDPKELQAWADATLIRERMAMIRGRLSMPGVGDVALLDMIEVAGVGGRFNGKTLVTGVRHRVGADGWLTDIQFGLSPEPFAARSDLEEAPAAGLLPGVGGLRTGVVDAFESDPDKEFRVRVILPGVDDQKDPVWARFASPDAGKERGYFFRPEVGDEVVLGFIDDDPRRPVVLGSLFGSKNSPPPDFAKIDEKNLGKGIVSRGGTIIRFIDDEKPAVSIETPAKNKVVLDDDAETVHLSDQHGNAITMNKDGIVLKSADNLMIEASGDVEIKAQNVDVK